jgi:hypothetical protein
MNERILELAEQSQIDDLAFDVWGDAYDVMRLDPEKFAELIVRECAVIGNKAYSDIGNYTYIGDKIREHFGVEE